MDINQNQDQQPLLVDIEFEEKGLLEPDQNEHKSKTQITSRLISDMKGPPIHIRCCDSCPLIIRFLRNIFVGLIGTLLFLSLIVPILLIIIVISYLFCCCFGGHQLSQYNNRTPSKTSLSPICCCCGQSPRYLFSSWRLRLSLVPIDKRGICWSLQNFIVGWYQNIEIILHASSGIDNLVYFANDLSNRYGDYFPLLYGFGCADPVEVKKYIENDGDLVKAHGIFTINSPDIVRFGYGKFEPIYLGSQNDFEDNLRYGEGLISHSTARKLHEALQIYFQKHYNGTQNRDKFMFDLKQVINKDEPVIKSCVKGLYYCLLGYVLSDYEADILVTFNSVGIAAILMPSWIHFFLGGYYLERNIIEKALKTVKDIYIRSAEKNVNHPVFLKIIEICREERIQLHEAINLLCTQPLIGGLPAIVHCCEFSLKALNGKNKAKFNKIYDASPYKFMIEALRLSGVPFGNMTIVTREDKEYEIAGKLRTIPQGSLLSLMHGCRMRESNIFGHDCNKFNPERENLLSATPFNCLEKGFKENKYIQQKRNARHRYCTGHDISLFVCQTVIDINKPDKDELKSSVNQEVEILFENTLTKHQQSNAKYLDNTYKSLDTYTKMLVTIMKLTMKENFNENPSTKDITLPQITDSKPEIIPLCGGIKLARVDEDHQKPDASTIMIGKLLSIKSMGKETNKNWPSIDAAIQWKEKFFDEFVPEPNIEFKELVSDHMISQLAFGAMPCHYMKRLNKNEIIGGNDDYKIPDNAEFISDFTAVSSFDVKKGYEKYGAAAYFNLDYKLIAIYWCHGNKLILPNDDDWNHGKWVWKSSMFGHITLIDHMYNTHLVASNSLVINCTKYLPTTHPLRILLKPFVYGAVNVNQKAYRVLISNQGIVNRLWAFEYETLTKIFAFAQKNYTFKLLTDFTDKSMENVDDNVFGFKNDANEFFKIVKKYVQSYLYVYYNNDSEKSLLNDIYINKFSEELSSSLYIDNGINNNNQFIDVITELICEVTGFHEHVGQVSDYLMSPDWIGCRLRENKEICSIQEYTQVLSLAAFTGLKAPLLMDDWSHLIQNDKYYTKIKNIYDEWHKDLINLSNKIDEKNKTRIFPTQSMNPRVMECSVSV
eukprot:165745_1